jgi:hypothetical protein
MTAQEEKAMLQARYTNDRRDVPPTVTSPSPPSAPPLRPRPPADYIQETKEQDMRMSTLLSEVDNHGLMSNGHTRPVNNTPTPPPSLPPKIPENP